MSETIAGKNPSEPPGGYPYNGESWLMSVVHGDRLSALHRNMAGSERCAPIDDQRRACMTDFPFCRCYDDWEDRVVTSVQANGDTAMAPQENCTVDIQSSGDKEAGVHKVFLRRRKATSILLQNKATVFVTAETVITLKGNGLKKDKGPNGEILHSWV
ncbi:hypothetical protein BU15DRAFT_62230 [Melanogaster broomeanus]|nr:hypothetical protein BU15DRAFT_62230 [Melanogaster broomeanus]